MFLASDSTLQFYGFDASGPQPVRSGRMSMDRKPPLSGDDRNREQGRLVAAMARGDKAAMA